MAEYVRVAVDVMGGDYAPVEPVKGAVVKGTIDEREVGGFTDEEGNFKTSYKSVCTKTRFKRL